MLQIASGKTESGSRARATFPVGCLGRMANSLLFARWETTHHDHTCTHPPIPNHSFSLCFLTVAVACLRLLGVRGTENSSANGKAWLVMMKASNSEQRMNYVGGFILKTLSFYDDVAGRMGAMWASDLRDAYNQAHPDGQVSLGQVKRACAKLRRLNLLTLIHGRAWMLANSPFTAGKGHLRLIQGGKHNS